eukprot:Rhum_TRINITY_DN9572_c0_g1::Rhum_TRINITY_DN9572_c0_g1_i1::g.34114::m.34114
MQQKPRAEPVAAESDGRALALPLDEYLADACAMVLPPQDAKNQLHVATVGFAAAHLPVELALGRTSDGSEKLCGLRCNLSRLTQGGGLQFQAATHSHAAPLPPPPPPPPAASASGCTSTVATPRSTCSPASDVDCGSTDSTPTPPTPLSPNTGYSGWLSTQSAGGCFHTSVAWSTEGTPLASDVVVRLGSITGTCRLEGGIGPGGVVLKGLHHAALSTHFNAGGRGSVRLGWRVLPSGMIEQVGLRYHGVRGQLGCVHRTVGLQGFSSAIVGDACRRTFKACAVADFAGFSLAAVAGRAGTRLQEGGNGGGGGRERLLDEVGFAAGLPVSPSSSALVRCGFSTFAPGELSVGLQWSHQRKEEVGAAGASVPSVSASVDYARSCSAPVFSLQVNFA